MDASTWGGLNRREGLNFVPIRLQMLFQDTSLAVGTGFLYLFDDVTFLVTNRHNVTGRDPVTDAVLHSQGGVPDSIALHIIHEETHEGHRGVRWDPAILDLYDDKGPIWYEHPTYQGRVDVVAIALRLPDGSAVIPVNDPDLDLDLMELRPGLDVFVLGYPKGMSGGGFLPIWKRGSIATDPNINIDELPKLLIDTATREGMSGSPVFAQEGLWQREGESNRDQLVMGSGRRFVGIYSGRVGDDTFLAQLGIVWKTRAIDEIIGGRVLGTSLGPARD